MPMKKHEMVLVFGKSASYYKPQLTEGTPYKRKWTPNKVNNMEYGIAGVITDNKGTRHPTTILEILAQQWRRQKPTTPNTKTFGTYEILNKTYSNEDDVVMDNCMGSNTTGLACKELNRQYIGIEKDKNYYDVSVSRVLS
jgi:site-specific DNA-methyltransferase (adenine-specific)